MAFLETMAKLIERYNSFFTEGIVNTLIIAAFSVLFGAILGTLMASLRMCRIPPLRWIAVAYIEFVRGTPLMVQLMFIFYGLPMIGITIPNISWIPNFSRFAAGIVAMSMNSCAYVAEIIRSGIQAVDGGQMEAARSVGFSSGEAMRLVVLPQAIRNILPALGNEFVTVIKESSIVSVIGIADLMFRRGVDVIFGSHSHRVGPVERRSITTDDGVQKDVVLAYGLGDYCAAQEGETNASLALTVEFTRTGESTVISDVRCTPLATADCGAGTAPRYQVFDAADAVRLYENNYYQRVSDELYEQLLAAKQQIEEAVQPQDSTK